MNESATPTLDAATTTLAEAVNANPGAARVFDRMGLDFCCHGNRSIAEASAAAGIDPGTVVSELGLIEAVPTDWADLNLVELIDHVLDVHHRYLHEELPLLVALAQKVATVHGERHPELAEMARLVKAIHDDLEPHMAKEETAVFPAIVSLVKGDHEGAGDSVAAPIEKLTEEHEGTGKLLEELRAVTRDFAVPADGCASYQSLYQRLDAMEADTHLHVHKENHILFPGALELARS